MLIDRVPVTGLAVQTDGRYLYAQLAGVGSTSLVRIDPTTGAVVARLPDLGAAGYALAGAAVWAVSVESDHVIRLHRWNSATMHRLPPMSYPVDPGTAGGVDPVVAVDTSRRNLFVGYGHTVLVIDAAKGRLLRRLALPAGSILGLAVNPGETVLYVCQRRTTDPRFFASKPPRLSVYDVTTGHVIRSRRVDRGIVSVTDLLATATGVVGVVANGNGLRTEYYSRATLRPGRPLNAGGGGLTPVPLAAGSAVYVVGNTSVTCADPNTGKARTTRSLGTHSYYTGIVRVRGHFYTGYDANTLTGVARLTPPATCA